MGITTVSTEWWFENFSSPCMQYCMLKLAFGCSIILVITWLLQPLAPSHFLHFLRRKNNMQAPTLYTKCQFDNPHMNLSWTLDKNTYNNKSECTFSHLICNHFSRKVVLEKWFCKIGFFFLVNHFSWTRKKNPSWRTTILQPEKRWIYSINPPFFLVNHFSRTRFLEPDF